MTKHDVPRSLGMRECWYFLRYRGCLAEVLHWQIEIVDALVGVVCVVVLATCGFTTVFIAVVITRFKHQLFNFQHSILNS